MVISFFQIGALGLDARMLIEVLNALPDVLFIFSNYFSRLIDQADARWV
jgi:hypothetical protein